MISTPGERTILEMKSLKSWHGNNIFLGDSAENVKLPWQLLQDFMQFWTIHPVFLIHSPDDAHNGQAALLSMHDETDKTR